MKSILILASHPRELPRLRLQEEERRIRSRLQSSGIVNSCVAARPLDMMAALLDYKPQVLHFMGHGTEEGIILEDDRGNANLLSNDTIDDLFRLFAKSGVECVVLNACYSSEQAEIIAEHIPYVIGVDQALLDTAAQQYSEGFYLAMAKGESYEFCHGYGKVAIKAAALKTEILPRIFVNTSRLKILDSQSKYLTQEKVIHNLPNPEYSKFVGREKEISRLFEHIDSRKVRQHVTVVDGIGGIGKTALVLEAAHQCKQARESQEQRLSLDEDIPVFDIIIFASAQQYYLSIGGEVERSGRDSRLRDIIQTIAQTLDEPGITQAGLEEQPQLVSQALQRQRSLLIIDNFETIDEAEQEKVLEFVNRLTGETRVIITTRERVLPNRACVVRLSPLDRKTSLRFIQQEANDKSVSLSPKEIESLFEHIGGVPLALSIIVGRISDGQAFRTVLSDLKSHEAGKDISKFCFESAVKSVRSTPAHQLLMARGIFEAPPILDALVEVSGCNLQDVDSCLDQLKRLSLLTEISAVEEDTQSRYGMLSFTRLYILQELRSNLDFRNNAELRWLEWYKGFTRKNGGLDWENWRGHYKDLEEGEEWLNLKQVIIWCKNQEKFSDLQILVDNLDTFIDLSGYWQTRLEWFEWLAEINRNTTRQSYFMRATIAQAWTHTLLDSYDFARQKIIEIIDLRSRVDDHTHALFAHLVAAYQLNQGNILKAERWLSLEGKLLERADLPSQIRQRHLIFLEYYRARIASFRGNHQVAKELFERVLQDGKLIGWTRFVYYAQHRLGEIALRDGMLSQARRYLKAALAGAEKNREWRRRGLSSSGTETYAKAAILDTEGIQQFNFSNSQILV